MARFQHPIEVALYILIASVSLRCILTLPDAFLKSYEYFGLTPSPSVVYVSAALQYGWSLYLLLEIWMGVHFVLRRKQYWVTWLVFFLTLALFIYYEVSFPFLPRR